MAFRKSDRPQISEVFPAAAIPGGEFQIRGKGLAGVDRPNVKFGELSASIVIGSDSFVIAKVPEGAPAGDMMVGAAPYKCDIGILMADSLHPVSNPVVDHHGSIYTTFSGSPGQKAPVSIYKIDSHHNAKPLVSDLMNATGLAMDAEGILYASSRHDGVVYQVSPGGNLAVFVEGMGVATGIAFDQQDFLYVGDRSGTIFKISRERQIYVFATIEPSIAAYHLAFGPDQCLYVTGPNTSSFDAVQRIDPDGHVSVFYRGLGRPQGIAFDRDSNLYIAASFAGRRGVVRISPQGHAEHVLSGSGMVGLALLPTGRSILATNNALFTLDWDVRGLPLLG